MEAQFSRKWEFLRQYGDVLMEKAVGRMETGMRRSLVFTGGTSLHLYSARLLFKDAPVRASEDIDFFNRDSRLLENPRGIGEDGIAAAYSGIIRGFGFESERLGSVVLVKPHGIKAEFFYDARSFPAKTYRHAGIAIVHPEALFRIKIMLLAERESASVRDLIDVLYLSTKYGLPQKIAACEDLGPLAEWDAVVDFLTPEGEEYFRRGDYPKLAANFIRRVEVHEKD